MNILKDYTVYKIVLEDGHEYVGSTSDLKQRIRAHISDCYNENKTGYKYPLYKHIRNNNLKFDKNNFVVLEQVENINKTDARMIEEKYRKQRVIQGGNVLNACMAFRTEEEDKEYYKEYSKERYTQNKDKILEKKKQYRIKNREKILEKNKQYRIKNREKYTCICGSTLTKHSKARHEKTLKHINFLQK
jgi:hypothetical protein